MKKVGFEISSPDTESPLERKSHLPDKIPKRVQIDTGATKMIFQGSSPDEVALVKYANEANLELIERDRTSVQLKNPNGYYENYEILANFPFSSQSKKMSILVKQKETGKIIYYVKGAEIVMESMIKSNQRSTLLEFCD